MDASRRPYVFLLLPVCTFWLLGNHLGQHLSHFCDACHSSVLPSIHLSVYLFFRADHIIIFLSPSMSFRKITWPAYSTSHGVLLSTLQAIRVLKASEILVMTVKSEQVGLVVHPCRPVLPLLSDRCCAGILQHAVVWLPVFVAVLQHHCPHLAVSECCRKCAHHWW